MQRFATLLYRSSSKPRYANNQHKLGSEIPSDPKETAFFKAMQLSKGVLIVHLRQIEFSWRCALFLGCCCEKVGTVLSCV